MSRGQAALATDLPGDRQQCGRVANEIGCGASRRDLGGGRHVLAGLVTRDLQERIGLSSSVAGDLHGGFEPVPPKRITLPGPVDPQRLLAAYLIGDAARAMQGMVSGASCFRT